jgi:hypothetical protein
MIQNKETSRRSKTLPTTELRTKTHREEIVGIIIKPGN